MVDTCAMCGRSSAPLITIRLGVSDRHWSAVLHESCLQTLLAARLAPLAADRPEGIPAHASCGVCGGRLPTIGRHPYFLAVGDAGAERHWFIHAHCLPEELQPQPSNLP